jgi:hypothetical protein
MSRTSAKDRYRSIGPVKTRMVDPVLALQASEQERQAAPEDQRAQGGADLGPGQERGQGEEDEQGVDGQVHGLSFG